MRFREKGQAVCHFSLTDAQSLCALSMIYLKEAKHSAIFCVNCINHKPSILSWNERFRHGGVCTQQMCREVLSAQNQTAISPPFGNVSNTCNWEKGTLTSAVIYMMVCLQSGNLAGYHWGGWLLIKHWQRGEGNSKGQIKGTEHLRQICDVNSSRTSCWNTCRGRCG